MSDLISRAEAIEAIASRDETDGTVKVFTGREVNEILSALPSADRPTGEWVYNPDAYDYGLPAWECDQCGCINANIPPRIMTKDSKPNYAPVNPNAFSGSNYCPNCGAKMGGDD